MMSVSVMSLEGIARKLGFRSLPGHAGRLAIGGEEARAAQSRRACSKEGSEVVRLLYKAFLFIIPDGERNGPHAEDVI